MNPTVSNRFRIGRTHLAFSLIELLVVIAIVALLASLLLPVLSKARGGSQAALCRSNLKQLALACAIYVSDNQQCFPSPAPAETVGPVARLVRVGSQDTGVPGG